MKTLFYILSIFFLIIGMYLVTLNWIFFWKSCVKKQHVGSWVPLIAGLLVMIGLMLYPENNVKRFCWIGLLIDPASIPGILYTIWQIHKDNHKMSGRKDLMKYYLVKIIHNDIEHYLIWYSGEEDGFLLFQQQLLVFCSVEEADEFADKEQIRFETETTVYNLTNLIELIKHTESSQNCRTLIDTWHFFSDLANALNEKFLGDIDEQEIIGIYDKLFYGSNIELIKNEEFHPKFNEDEEHKCSEIFQSGLSILDKLDFKDRF